VQLSAAARRRLPEETTGMPFGIEQAAPVAVKGKGDMSVFRIVDAWQS
jgi:hypothetical protein